MQRRRDRRDASLSSVPSQVGLRTGSTAATAPTSGDFKLDATQLYLRASLFEKRISERRIDETEFVP